MNAQKLQTCCGRAAATSARLSAHALRTPQISSSVQGRGREGDREGGSPRTPCARPRSRPLFRGGAERETETEAPRTPCARPRSRPLFRGGAERETETEALRARLAHAPDLVLCTSARTGQRDDRQTRAVSGGSDASGASDGRK